MLPQLIELTGDPAKVVSIADFSATELGAKVTSGGGDKRAALEEAVRLFESGDLRMVVEETYSIEQTPGGAARQQDRPPPRPRGHRGRAMSWTAEELAAVGDADELRIASRREDGSLRPLVTIWAVRAGDDLLVRSAHGRANGWFRRAVPQHAGRIDAGGVTKDVRFEEVPADDHAAGDAAYHAKYDHYPKEYVDPVVSPDSWAATLRLVPEA